MEPGNHDITQTTKTTTKTTHKQKQTDRQAGSKTDRHKQTSWSKNKTKQFTVSVFIIAGITNTV